MEKSWLWTAWKTMRVFRDLSEKNERNNSEPSIGAPEKRILGHEEPGWGGGQEGRTSSQKRG